MNRRRVDTMKTGHFLGRGLGIGLGFVIVWLAAVSGEAATVNYPHRVAYYTTWAGGTAGIYDGGDTNEVGHYAQGSGGQSVGWRTYRTAGGTGGSARELQHGDEFTISVYGDSPHGVLGMSVNDGASTGSWANRHSNTRGFIQTGSNTGGANTNADWFVHHNSGSTGTGANLDDETDDMEVEVTSSSTFNARVDGGSWNYNLTMKNSPGTNDLIDGFSIYYNDDWDGGARQDAFWKPTTSIENTKAVHFGGTTDVTPGLIADGLDADSTSTTSTNLLFKFDSHTLTLSEANTYSGSSQLEAGTTKISQDSNLGTAPTTATADHLVLWGGATLQVTSTFTLDSDRGILLDNGSNPTFLIDSGATLTYDGIIVDDVNEGLTKTGTGILELGGTSTYGGQTTVSAGELRQNGTNTSTEVSVASGATLSGLGRVGRTTINGTISAGDGDGSIGILKTTTIGLNSGGALVVEFSDAGGSEGVGWDLVQMGASGTSGVISNNASSGSPFTIKVDSQGGSLTGWDNTTDDSWRIIKASSSVGFSADEFTVDTTDWGVSLAGGTFSVTEATGDIYLSFSAFVPPLLGLGPNSLAYTMETGTGTSNLTVTVTNVSAGGTLMYYSSDDASWLTFNAATGSLAAGVSQVHTATVDVTSLSAGTYTSILHVCHDFVDDDFGNASATVSDDSNTELDIGWNPEGSTISNEVVGGVMVVTNTSASAKKLLSDEFTDRSLDDIGDKISARFDFNLNVLPAGTENGGLKFGLYDNGNSDQGYYAQVDLGSAKSGDAFELYEDNSGTTAMTGGSEIDQNNTTPLIDNTSSHSATITVERISATLLQITANIDGTEITATDGTFSTFDGFGYRINDHVSIDFDDIVITHCEGVEVVLTLTAPALDPPSSPSASADGEQAMDLNWSQNAASDDVLVVRMPSATIPSPVNGTAYTAGEALSGGTVIYNGSATAFKDTALVENTTYYYYFFSVDGSDNYSSSVTTSATTANTFTADEIYDSFSYTNAATLGGSDKGTGFSGSWSASAPATADITIDTNRFTSLSGYPDQHGHRLFMATTNTATYSITRSIDAVDCGQLYVSAYVRYQFGEGSGDNKFAGIALLNGSSETGFVGHIAVGNDAFGIEEYEGSSIQSAGNESISATTEYLFIGKYDFEKKTFSGKRYSGTSVPVTEPSYDVTATLGTVAAQIDGIRLKAGAELSGWPGEVHFDEVRVAKSWGELLGYSPPRIETYAVDETAYPSAPEITDGQLAAGGYEVSVDLDSPDSTVDTDGAPYYPNYDFFNPAGTEIVADEDFTGFSGAGPVTATGTAPTVVFANVSLGVHTVQVSAAATDTSSLVDISIIQTNCDPLTFNVIDDDTNAPILHDLFNSGSFWGSGGGSNYLIIATNGTIIDDRSFSDASVVYRLYDDYVYGLTSVSNVQFVLGAQDDTTVVDSISSGIAQGNSGTTNAVTSLDIPTVLDGDDFIPVYDATDSGNDLTLATSIWTFVDNSIFTTANIDAMFDKTNEVYATVPDGDNDRADDGLTLYHELAGHLAILDDDPLAPIVKTMSDLGTDWPGGLASAKWLVSTGGLQAARSGPTASRTWTVCDQTLATLSGSDTLDLIFGAVDVGPNSTPRKGKNGSGISRSSSGSDTNVDMSISIGTVIEDNFSAYNSAKSTPFADTIGTGSDGETGSATNTWTFNSPFTDTEIEDLMTGGSNVVRVRIPDGDDDRTDDRSIAQTNYGYLVVKDDDLNKPIFGTALSGSRAMEFLIGSTNYSSGTGTDVLSEVTDGDLNQISAGNPMKFVYNVYDEDSGLSRSTADPITNLNFDVGTIAPDIIATYVSGDSSSDTKIDSSTSVFEHASNFSTNCSTCATVSPGGNYYPVEDTELWDIIAAGSNAISVSVFDTDLDWGAGDRLSCINQTAGWLSVTDDDTEQPEATLVWAGNQDDYTLGDEDPSLIVTDSDILNNKMLFAFKWVDASGMFVTNASGADEFLSGRGNVNMNMDFLTTGLDPNPDINLIHATSNLYVDNGGSFSQVSTIGSANGASTVLVVESSATVSCDNYATGVWSLTVSAQDFDEDRGHYQVTDTSSDTQYVSFDREVRTNQLLQFTVKDDDEDSPEPWQAQGMDMELDGQGQANGGSNSNTLFTISDGELAEVSALIPLEFIFNVYDYSGINRGTTDPTTNMSMTVTDLITSNVANFVAGSSSNDTTMSGSISVWEYTSGFSFQEITTLFTNLAAGAVEGTNTIYVTMMDTDKDLEAAGCAGIDKMSITNLQIGLLNFTDEDSTSPNLRDISGANDNSVEVWVGGDTKLGYTGTNVWDGTALTVTFDGGSPSGQDSQHEAVYELTDGDLANASVSTPIQIMYEAADFFSIDQSDETGISYDRAETGDTSTNSWLSIGSAIQSNTIAFDEVNSANISNTAENRVTKGTNYWTFTSFTSDQICDLTAAYSNDMQVNLIDLDVDRENDQTSTNFSLGSLYVTDDDTNSPSAPAVSGSVEVWTNNSSVYGTINIDTAATDASGILQYNSSTDGTDPGSSTNGTVQVATGIETSFDFSTHVAEGENTNYVFALDADADRCADWTKGSNDTFLTRYDVTEPPAPSSMAGVVGDDPSSEIDLTWGASANAGNRSGDNATLSPWFTYEVYYTIDGSEPTTNSPSYTLNNYSSLDTNTAVSLTLTDLLFGVDYRVMMTGRDRAGNESPASGVVTVSLIGFVITQGIQEVNGGDTTETNGMQIGWLAANDAGRVTKEYDLIYVDRLFGFYESTTDEWQLVTSIYSNYYPDTGSATRVAPLLMGETMRFYRASYKDKWLIARKPRNASPEIYVMKNVNLEEGQNWVCLPGIPDFNTPSHVFGHKMPAGFISANSTTITWFDRSYDGTSLKQIFLQDYGTSNSWRWSLGGSGNAENYDLPVIDGFVIELPDGSGSSSFPFIGQIPTNTITQQLKAGYNLISTRIPRKLLLPELNLVESGFRGSSTPPAGGGNGDMLWKWSREDQQVPSGHIMWYSDGSLPAADPAGWYYTKFTTESKWQPLPADLHYLRPDDAVIIYRPNSPSEVTLTNKILYLHPNAFVSP